MAFNRGETIRLKASNVKDLDGTLITAPTFSIAIIKPDGTTETTLTTATESSAGNFYTDYTIPATGPLDTWKVKWSITKSGKTGIESFDFVVR